MGSSDYIAEIRKRQRARKVDQNRRAASNLRCITSVKSAPFTYVVPNHYALEHVMNNTVPVGSNYLETWRYKDRTPNEGDLARTLEDIDSKYYIRIDGKWVNLLGVCDSTDANTQPVRGHVSRPGISDCLAAVDHRHGIPDSFTYWDVTTLPDANGVLHEVGRFLEYEEGTFAFITNDATGGPLDIHKGYIRCNQEWVCFTHIT